jgi:stage III sporulation protein AB
MWFKLIGSILIVTATTCIGFAFARRFNDRPQQIRQLIGFLTSLKAYIGYVSMPLPQALARCCIGIEGPVRSFFQTVAEILENNGWLTPQEAMKAALNKLKGELAFLRPETELLLLLSSNLGLTNGEEQQKYLGMVVEELGKIEAESAKARDQNAKMYRYLGICGGLAVVIILV